MSVSSDRLDILGSQGRNYSRSRINRISPPVALLIYYLWGCRIPGRDGALTRDGLGGLRGVALLFFFGRPRVLVSIQSPQIDGGDAQYAPPANGLGALFKLARQAALKSPLRYVAAQF